jgi:hypothetical protein
MPFLPLPKENSSFLARLETAPDMQEYVQKLSKDIHALYLYLERIREDSFNTTSEGIASDPSGLLEGLSNLFVDSSTINFIVTLQNVTAEIKLLSVALNQLQDIAFNSFLGKGSTGIGVQNILLGEGLSITNGILQASGAFDRVVALEETRTILDTASFVVSRYFRVDGLLQIQGDGALQVL